MHTLINCHTGIPVSGLVESVSAPILRILFPGTDEEYDEKVQLLTDVSALEKEKQTKTEVEIEKKKKEEKAKEIRKRAEPKEKWECCRYVAFCIYLRKIYFRKISTPIIYSNFRCPLLINIYVAVLFVIVL